MPSLSEYLAKNYLTASSASNTDPSDNRPTKKRKKNRTNPDEANTLLIADDDDGLLLSNKGKNGLEGREQDGPLMYNTKVRSAEFRKSKKNAWQTIPATDEPDDTSKRRATYQDEDDADTLLRETMASDARTKANLEAENAPAVVEDTQPRMESGARAGLQTAADTARLMAAQEALDAQEAATQALKKRRKKEPNSTPEPEEETIYRDATGRRIDLTLRRQEARRAELEKLAADKKARDDALGDVQLRERAERKQELEDAKFLSLSRGIDDEEMNDRLKGEVRWNDPMAAYMASRRDEQETATDPSARQRSSKNVAQPRRKEYVGAAPPNRYAIKPGWRWDGVDRGNGFEKEWFQARGKKARNESLEYQWQMDE